MARVRIGTWNLQGRWDDRHLELLTSLRCDVLLLTDVSDRVAIPGMRGHVAAAEMARRRR